MSVKSTDVRTQDPETHPAVLRAETPVYGGYVMARDGRVIFIRGAIPGELVEISVDEKKKDYSIGSVKNIIEPSSFRRQPQCSIFGECGGCHLQYMCYEKQVSIKEDILIDAMRRIGGIDVQLMPSMVDKEFGYRQRGQFKVSQKGEIGFYREGTRDVIPVVECPVMVDEINHTLQRLKGIDIKGAREIHIISGDTVALLVRGSISDDAAQRILDSGISGIGFDNGDSLGKDYITLDLNDLRYSVTPWSFFQSHWSLNRKVVDAVINRLMPLDNRTILDLYAGAGNFSIPLSMHAKRVVAVEENVNAVEDGRRNALLNGIKNCNFINLPVGRSFEGRGKQKAGKLFGKADYDIIILDPPRAGLTSECLKYVIDTWSQKVVYVSCNPATLARDISKMKDKYEIESMCMVDFFPNTYHIEALVFLNRKAS